MAVNKFSFMLKNMRKKKKLSQKELAMDLGITQSMLSHYESGKREPSLDRLIEFAKYFNVSCDQLLGYSEYIENEEKSDNEFLRVLDLISQLVYQTQDNDFIEMYNNYMNTCLYKIIKLLSDISTDVDVTLDDSYLIDVSSLEGKFFSDLLHRVKELKDFEVEIYTSNAEVFDNLVNIIEDHIRYE